MLPRANDSRAVAILLAVVSCCAVAIAESRDPFSLSIAAVNSEVPAGSPVMIDVTLENTSNHDISVYRDNSPDQGGLVYKADVRDEDGKTAVETEFGRAVQGHDTLEQVSRKPYVIVGSGGDQNLAPGKEIKDRINVSKLYDLHQPGKYTIQLERFDLETKSFIKSNKITVTVRRVATNE